MQVEPDKWNPISRYRNHVKVLFPFLGLAAVIEVKAL